MQLLFESHPDIFRCQGKLYWFQAKPALRAEPVLVGDGPADATGASIYGSVLRDGGMYRMWYQAWPVDWVGGDAAHVGYAESDDGIVWRKPKLGLVDVAGSRDNNLCDLGVHAPSVFIDPDAPPSHRYRATGCIGAGAVGAHRDAGVKGYYTAHSADGLHWNLDSTTPTWPWMDVITSIYHPGRRGAQVALKRMVTYGGFVRRAVWEAAGVNGDWSDARAALLPDDFDDTVSMAMGYRSADYYGMGMMPAGRATVGFLWVFRHRQPVAMPSASLFGEVDVSLVYQHGPGERWVHAPGRKNFIDHNDLAITVGGLYTASNVVDAGDEQRLYFSGAMRSHGWHLDEKWNVIEANAQQVRDESLGKMSYASWPKDRLFGFRSDPEGVIHLDFGDFSKPMRFTLNAETESRGSIRVQAYGRAGKERRDIPGRNLEDSIAFTGDSHTHTMQWRDGDVIQPVPGYTIRVCVHMNRAKAYGFDLQPA